MIVGKEIIKLSPRLMDGKPTVTIKVSDEEVNLDLIIANCLVDGLLKIITELEEGKYNEPE